MFPRVPFKQAIEVPPLSPILRLCKAWAIPRGGRVHHIRTLWLSQRNILAPANHPKKQSNWLRNPPRAVKSTASIVEESRGLAIPSPYEEGSQLTLCFVPEGEDRAIPLEVTILKSFKPFTIAQSLLVRPVQPQPLLPPLFIVKVVDPRFSYPGSFKCLNHNGWTIQCDQLFKDGLEKLRQGVWGNYWKGLDAEGGSWPVFRDDRLHATLSPEQVDWNGEMDRWICFRRSSAVEHAAYRQLRALQGNGIPRLYGRCRLTLTDNLKDIDPLIAVIPGIVIEYIDGTHIDQFSPGRNISEGDAERMSQGLLSIVRKIRDNLVRHNDLVARNIIIPKHDSFRPIIIDFGSASIRQYADHDNVSEEDWIRNISRGMEPFVVRNLLQATGLHNPSPVPEEMHEMSQGDDAELYGLGALNWNIERLRPEWRDWNYEPLGNVPLDVIRTAPNGTSWVWQHLRWKVKASADTGKASLDYRWGRKEPEYGWLPRQ